MTPLAEAMDTRGISCALLAQCVNVHPLTVVRWRSGDRQPRPRTARAVAAVLGVPAEQLFSEVVGLDRAVTRLEVAMTAAGHTPSSLAAAVRARPETVRRWITGHGSPSTQQARRVARVLRTPVRDLFPGYAPSPTRNPHRLLPAAEVLRAPATGQPGWQRQALCGTRPAEWWWPEPDDPDPTGLRARRICARCPVLGDCRDFFLADPELSGEGIWAGMPGDRLRAAVGLSVPTSPRKSLAISSGPARRSTGGTT
jgi:DNA-binding XRE family transcriptional regulator